MAKGTEQQLKVLMMSTQSLVLRTGKSQSILLVPAATWAGYKYHRIRNQTDPTLNPGSDTF